MMFCKKYIQRFGSRIRLGFSGMRSSGFTLVEVMVSSVLLAVVILSALALFVQVTRSSQLVRRRTDATSIAWSRIERARNLQFDEIDELIEGGEGTRVNEAGLTDETGKFLRKTSVVTDTNGVAVKRIRIEVIPEGLLSKEFDVAAEVLETIITDVPKVEEDD
ncbi:prepilin-type N-terminal cleavage/methylation domain-containing protein [Kiritimatiellaeota bacterium B1221]|nr:prepilin-type N-terminal cleavage/methylation domain-containing protein [Kiritimatiellaeota bacterium B1221]